jgi:hypothetical protein
MVGRFVLLCVPAARIGCGNAIIGYNADHAIRSARM